MIVESSMETVKEEYTLLEITERKIKRVKDREEQKKRIKESKESAFQWHLKRVAQNKNRHVSRAIVCKSTTILITDCRLLFNTTDCRVLVDTTAKKEVDEVDVVIKRLLKCKTQLEKETQEVKAVINTLTKQKEHFKNEDIGLVGRESRWN